MRGSPRLAQEELQGKCVAALPGMQLTHGVSDSPGKIRCHGCWESCMQGEPAQLRTNKKKW